MRLGLRTRYAVSTSCLIIVVVLVLSTGLIWHFRDALGNLAQAGMQTLSELGEAQLRNHGLEFSHLVSQNVSGPFSRMDIERMHEVLRNTRQHHSVEYLMLFDEQGRSVLDGLQDDVSSFGEPVSESFVTDVLDDEQPVVRHRNGIMDVVVPVYGSSPGGTGTVERNLRRGSPADGGTRLLGGLWIGFSKEMMAERLSTMGAQLSALRVETLREELVGVAVLTMALLVGGVLVAVQLGRRLTDPILKLATTAARIGQSQPTTIDVSRRDEVGDLAKAIAAMQERLRETTVSKDYLGGIIHSLNEALLVTDSEWRIRLTNRATRDNFGFEEEQLIGRPIGALFNGPEECRPLLEAGSDSVHRECRFKTKSGKSVPVVVSASPLSEKTGAGRVFVVQNITERKEMEEELHRYRENLEQLVAERTRELSAVNQELESFSYSVSHDLRTPLRALNGFSQMLREDYRERLDAEGQGYLERIRGASERMSQMIDGMLTLSRVARREIKREPVDLSALAEEVVEELRSADPGRRAEVHIESGLEVCGDPALLHLLMQNLLHNAWKFTTSREPARIEFGHSTEDGQTFFFVRDNGNGFDMNEADELFKPFRRLEGAQHYEGTGIGLATVSRVVLRHGGRIWADGTPGEGATFCFTIPSHPYAHRTVS